MRTAWHKRLLEHLPDLQVALLVLVQVTSFADVGALTGGTVAAAEPARRGAALSLYALVDYTTGFIGPGRGRHGARLVRRSRSVAGWGAAFAIMAICSAVAARAVHRAPGAVA
jgi:hypothetical protein